MFFLTIFRLFVFNLFFHSTFGAGACYPPFSKFLDCMKSETQSRIDLYQQESTSLVQNNLRACFYKHSCTAPQLSNLALHDVLPQPWAHRVGLMMDLFETSHPAVQQCMITFFTRQAGQQVQQCIRDNGNGDAKNFQLPSLPKLENIDLKALKLSVLNRLVVSESLVTCSKKTPSNSQLGKVITCIQDARSDHVDTICNARDVCRSNHIDWTSCKSPFNYVQQAACNCAKVEQAKFAKNDYKSFQKIIRFFIKGELTKQYEQCCFENRVPVPAKLQLVSDSIRKSIKDAMLIGMPAKVRHMTAQLVVQISDEIQNMLCGSCSEKFADKQVRQVREMANTENQPSYNPLADGLSGFLSNLFAKP